MNIQEATEQIEGAVEAYLTKDERGLYLIPFRMQRPIIMFGPPGVGKTAIVEQIAERLGVNYVSYSITHHTRQSALGLPFIEQEEFGGRDYSVSEYTMSEIIASVYRAQAASGVSEGILFLDEVNCVSETLAPAMLQFLQYKTFGMHQLPEGWVIVCAGNPPEYNRAAREFDAAMLDRMKRIDVEPDLEVWQTYAASHGVHPAVTTYLDSKPQSFYKVHARARGSKIVTSRGWEDLSRMLQAYEVIGREAGPELIRQYLQDEEISEDFGAYYQLFRKYQDDYKVSDILAGNADQAIVERASAAAFDERVALVGLLIDAMLNKAHKVIELEEALVETRSDMLSLKPALEVLGAGAAGGADAGAAAAEVAAALTRIREASEVGKRAKGMAGRREVVKAERLRVLEAVKAALTPQALTELNGFEAAKTAFNAECRAQAELVKAGVQGLDNSFLFLDEAFSEDAQESLIYITKLSADAMLIKLVTQYGSREFMKHNKSLLFHERGLNLRSQIEALSQTEALEV